MPTTAPFTCSILTGKPSLEARPQPEGVRWMEKVSPGRLTSMEATSLTLELRSGKSEAGRALEEEEELEPVPRLATKAATPAASAVVKRTARALVFMGS